MKKNIKTIFTCQHCATTYPKWQGKCDGCLSWNTIEEVVKDNTSISSSNSILPLTHHPQPLDAIACAEAPRILCQDAELNRVLGGGIVIGSVTLLGGEPGIGKSTVLLQNAIFLDEIKILYVSGEESELQVKLRANRLSEKKVSHCYILNETLLENILTHVDHLHPNLLIIDSIQTIYTEQLSTSVGSVAQIKACTTVLMQLAKRQHLPIILIGHITKEGILAGPKVLEHMVDTVLQFEGDRHLSYRLLRTLKNRFGSTDELGIYKMYGNGLQEVSNPSSLLLSHHEKPMSGVAIGTSLEGNRVLLIETQALVSPTAYGHAQRSATGFDQKRLHMLLAVLEKRAGLRLGVQDVFLNITGGIRVDDPALDLALCMAMASAYKGLALPAEACFLAEVGLSGELRRVNRIDNRIAEAKRLGFNQIYMAKQDVAKKYEAVDLSIFSTLEEVLLALF